MSLRNMLQIGNVRVSNLTHSNERPIFYDSQMRRNIALAAYSPLHYYSPLHNCTGKIDDRSQRTSRTLDWRGKPRAGRCFSDGCG